MKMVKRAEYKDRWLLRYSRTTAANLPFSVRALEFSADTGEIDLEATSFVMTDTGSTCKLEKIRIADDHTKFERENGFKIKEQTNRKMDPDLD